MKSTTLYDQRVYAQDTPPEDKRDGILWVDTSKEPPATNVYAVDTDSWEPTAPGNVTVSDNEPTGKNEGHIWVDTTQTNPTPKILDSGGNWNYPARAVLADNAENLGGSPPSVYETPTSTQSTAQNPGYVTLRSGEYPNVGGWGDSSESVNRVIDEVRATISDSNYTGSGVTIDVENEDGAVIATLNHPVDGSTVSKTFDPEEVNTLQIDTGGEDVNGDMLIKVHAVVLPAHTHQL